MGFLKPKQPKTPDPVSTSAAQASQNTMAANANTIASSGSVTNPYGTRTSAVDYVDVMNPLTGKMESVARNNVTESLSPGQQAIFDQNQQSETNLAKYGNQQTAELLNRGSTPFQYNTGEHEAWAGNLYNQINADTMAANDEALRSRLANQGIKMGSAAYDREMANFAKGRDNARNQFLLDSQQQGYQQALATRNQQTNEPLAIASGTQIQMPNFTPGRTGTVANVDHTANVWNGYSADVNAANQRNASIGGLFSSLGNAAMMLSERDMKKNIEKLPMKAKGGIQMYDFNYKGEPKGTPKHRGVMADEAQRKMPAAVAKGKDGLRRVNMGMVMGR